MSTGKDSSIVGYYVMSAGKDSSIVGCYVVATGKYLRAFRRIVVSSATRSSSPRRVTRIAPE